MATLTTEYQLIGESNQFSISSARGVIRLYAKYNSQNIVNNTTNVTFQLRAKANVGSWYSEGNSSILKIDNSSKGTIKYKIGTVTSTEKEIGTWTFDISHLQDGSFSGSAYAWADVYANVTPSLTVTFQLPTIARASTATMSNATIGYPSTINISRASTTFYHTLTYAFGNLSETIATNVGDSYMWTIPSSFYSQIQNDKLGQGTIYCTTYQNGVQIGNTKSTNFICYIDELNSRPTLSITSMTSDNNTQTLTGANNKFINSYSNATINATLTAKNSASVREFRVANGSKSLTGTTGNSSSTINDTINNITDSIFVFYNKDTRELSYNNIYAYNQGVTFLNYKRPTITNLVIERTEQTSTEVILSVNGTYWNDTFGSTTNVNSLQYAIRKKEASSSTWSNWSNWQNLTTTGANYYINELSLGDDFDTQKSYDFQIKLRDALSTLDSSQEVISSIQNVTVSTPIIEIYDDRFNVNGDLSINEGKPFIYSTNEIFTGKYWIDGKPLYRIVVQGDLPSTPNTWGNIANLPSNIKIRNITGILEEYLPIPVNITPDYLVALQCIEGKLQGFTKGYVSNYVRVTIEYTKTTD